VYAKACCTQPGQAYGSSVALSADGTVLAVGAPREFSPETSIAPESGYLTPGTGTDAIDSGAAYIVKRTGIAWNQIAYIKPSNSRAGAKFGTSVALSGDGSTLVVGAPQESSAAIGVGGNEADTTAAGAGAAYVFTASLVASPFWAQQAYVKASNTAGGDNFGTAVSLNGDGSVLAVGAPSEDGSATGINGTPDTFAANAGSVYVYARVATSWSQQAYVKASNTGGGDGFGSTVSLASDGATLVVGAPSEAGAGVALGADGANNAASQAGAAYVFTRSASTWSQFGYVKASNTKTGDRFGTSAVVSGNGNAMAVGAASEAGNGTGINAGNQADTSKATAGAVYLY
jgi:hypothetical protein